MMQKLGVGHVGGWMRREVMITEDTFLYSNEACDRIADSFPLIQIEKIVSLEDGSRHKGSKRLTRGSFIKQGWFTSYSLAIKPFNFFRVALFAWLSKASSGKGRKSSQDLSMDCNTSSISRFNNSNSK